MPFLPLFAGIHHSLAHVLTVPPTKVWLLCTTPTGLHLCIQAMPVGTYWVQSPGFLKIVYYHRLCKGKHGFSVSAWWFQAPALRVTLWEPHDPVGVSKCDSLYIYECVKVQLLWRFTWWRNKMVIMRPSLSRKVRILCTCMKVSGSSCYRFNGGNHMALSEQKGVDPLYLYEGFRF